MKYTLNLRNLLATASLLMMAAFLTTNAQAQASADVNAGVLSFEKDMIDYGTVEHKSDGMRTFNFKNTGKTPVVIIDIKSSCGCTVATKPTQPVMPGETAEISVKYATNRVGPFSKSITVISNARESRKVLKIKGKVLPAEGKS